MHLERRPVYFIKGSSRKAAYYTVQVRELLADGWTQEQVEAPTQEEALIDDQDSEGELEAEVVMIEMDEQQEPEKGLDEMTKAELIAYAEGNDIQFKPYATKSEILEACQAAENG